MFNVGAINMSEAPVAFCYDADGIYTHSEPFSLDPLESEKAGKSIWLQPAMSITTSPGEKREGYAWLVRDNHFEEVEDHRGKNGFVDGKPITVNVVGPLPEGWSGSAPATESSAQDKIKAEISALEFQQTPRRLREAALTEEGKVWLQNLEDQIAAKRAELAGLS